MLTDGGAAVDPPTATLPVKHMASRMGMCIDHGYESMTGQILCSLCVLVSALHT